MSSFPALPTRKRISLFAGISLLCLLLAGFFALPGMLQAASPSQGSLIQVQTNTAQVRYRQGVLFQLTVFPGAGSTISKALLKVKYGNRGPESTYDIKLLNGSGTHLIADETENLTTGMPLFYSWTISDGKTQLQTTTQMVIYEDTHQNWRQREGNQLTLRWYDGDEKYGDLMYQLGADTLATYKRRFNFDPLQQIYITIYGSSQAYHATFPEAPPWSGGLTRYGGVEIIVIAPQDHNASVFIGEGIPHELSHAALYQFLGLHAPRWLDEGFAVYNQNTIDIKAYDDLVQTAYNANSMISLQDLMSRWPSQAEGARLAYGEGRSMVTFLINTYGSQAWTNLLDQLRRHDVDTAFKECFGVDLAQMENLWKRKVLAHDQTVKMPPALKLGPVPSQPNDTDLQTRNTERTASLLKSEETNPTLYIMMGVGFAAACGLAGLLLIIVRRYQKLNSTDFGDYPAWQPPAPAVSSVPQSQSYKPVSPQTSNPLRRISPSPATGNPPLANPGPALALSYPPFPVAPSTNAPQPSPATDPFDLIMASFGQTSNTTGPAISTPAGETNSFFLNIDPYYLNFDPANRYTNQPLHLAETETEKL